MQPYPERAAGEAAVRDGTSEVLVVQDASGSTLVWKDTVDARTESVLAAAVQQVERSAVAAELSLAPAEVGRLVAPQPPASTTLVPPDPQRVPRVIGATPS